VRVEYSYAFFCLPTASLLKDTDERRWESGLRPPLYLSQEIGRWWQRRCSRGRREIPVRRTSSGSSTRKHHQPSCLRLPAPSRLLVRCYEWVEEREGVEAESPPVWVSVHSPQSPPTRPPLATRVSPKWRRRRRIPGRILGRLMRLAWPRKFSSRARKFSKSNPPSEPVVRVEFYVAFSGSCDPVRFWKEAAFLGRILPKNSLGRAAWSKKNRSSPPFLVSSFFSLMFLSIFS